MLFLLCILKITEKERKPFTPERERDMTDTTATPPLPETASSRSAESVLRNALKEQGQRCTSARIAVLREIYSSGSHLDADELYQRLKKRGVSISRATVYHTLDLLFRLRLVTRIDLGHKHTHYEKSHGVANHLHVVCEQCGQVVEITSSELGGMLEKLCRQQGFELGSYSLQVFGQCIPEMRNHSCTRRRKK